MNESLAFAPACERNKQPILEVLQAVLPNSGLVLEIGSGTGQHVVHFAANMPQLQWQPSEQAENLASLQQRLNLQASANVLPAIVLDVAGDWPELTCQAIVSANTAHIMSWPEVIRMFDGVAGLLQPGGVFSLYGPFNENGQFTAASNQQFDQSLKDRNPLMGLRDVAELEELAHSHHMKLERQFALPANNQILLFRQYDPAGQSEG
jgi:SAM-dependent methyltransferase